MTRRTIRIVVWSAIAGVAIAYFKYIVAALIIAVYYPWDILNPFYYPRIELEFHNETEKDIRIDLTDVWTLDSDMPNSPRQVIYLRAVESMKLGHSRRDIISILRSRWAGAIEAKYVELATGLPHALTLSLDHPTFRKCRFKIVIRADGHDLSPCLPRVMFSSY